ncbi:hypothetical protein A6J39_014290 [Legionella anisa]|uniref:Uncharacterized protein n=2 Tax=Legionella anisa TaxID=28082 RepID=A0AAX0WVG3_9GAMM|nr:hypothetical protein DLD14_08115 [Legionella anisa]PNL62287.1 hypothetical protein A6J39_014290 [Legionella anisa]
MLLDYALKKRRGFARLVLMINKTVMKQRITWRQTFFPPQHNVAVQRNKIKKNIALIPRDELIIRFNSTPDK